jgi:hypothetical protein
MKVTGKQVIKKVQKGLGFEGRKSKHDAYIMVVKKGTPSKRFP